MPGVARSRSRTTRIWVGSAVVTLIVACAAPAPPAPTPTAIPALAAIQTPGGAAQTIPPTTVPSVTPALTATKPPAAAGAPAQTPKPGSPLNVATLLPQSQSQSAEPVTETADLAARFEAALNAGEVDTAVALFADNAEVKIPPDRYVGLSQISEWLRYLASIHFLIEPGFRRVVGERASWSAEIRSDYLEHIGLPSLNGNASLLVQGGRIQNYTFFLTEDSAHRHRAAQLAASEVLQDPVIVGLDAANVYGFDDVFRDSSGQLVSYRDVLTADPGSGPFYDLGGEPIVIRSGF
jgi:hypothetical protein